MRICILGNQSRAVSIFWRVLITTLRERGHDVLCFVPAGDPESEAVLTSLGAGVRNYRLDRKGLNPLRDMATFLDLRALFRRERIDVLFATTIKPVIYGCLAARLAGVPHIYATITGLGYAFEQDSFFKKCVHALSVFLYRTALRNVSGVFFQNRDNAETFRSDGILAPDARVLFAWGGTGVDTTHFTPRPLPEGDTTVFLTIGRLLEAKGFREFAEAARLVNERRTAQGKPRARFQILGPKETGLGSISEEEIEAWKRGGDVEYLGATRDVIPFLAACHVHVLASWGEGTPTSVMEAMSVGRANVVTDAPGCREVVKDGENGLLVPVRNPQALADAMERLADDPALVALMGERGRKLAVERFDARVVAAGIVRDMGLDAAPGA